MSVEYRAVNWNRQKRIYDGVVAAAVPVMVGVFFLATLATHPYMTAETGLIRGLGLTAFLLLHVILVIGPLARLNPAFLPLLYNRRHLGVAMCLVALGHAGFAIFQYHALGDVNPLVSLLVSNTAFGSVSAFPFELLGLLALLILLVMAATSHDFWLSVLSPPTWKMLHMLVYVAYALLVGHIGFGVIQTEGDLIGPLATLGGAVLVIGLHLAAGLRERAGDRLRTDAGEWVTVCRVDDIKPNRARIGLVGGERVAVFRYDDKLSCVSNVCRHQNGPLGEGKIVDGCITCPWHGYQYQPDNGTSPPPFSDKVATYNLRVENGAVLVHSAANPPGTRVEPVSVAQDGSAELPDEFYVGYLPKAPPASARATRHAVVTMALLGCGTLLTLAVAQPPFAAATFEYGHPHTMQGTVSSSPYPVLRIAEAGRVRQYLLAGQGKHGAVVAPYEGLPVRVVATLIQRGNARMLEVASLSPDSSARVDRPAHEELGRFALTGEIVDGKCWLGVMNPGEGKTHLDCAVRCISGGLPPMLVVRDSAGTERHLLLTGPDGAPLSGTLLPRVGRAVTVTGDVSREGELYFLGADPADIRLVP